MTTAAVVVTVGAPAPALASPPPGYHTYTYTGTPQFYDVPSDVHRIRVSASGASGAATGGAGGAGATVTGTLAVEPYSVFRVYVGDTGNARDGGWNGGGDAGDGSISDGGGGGGATDIRADSSLESRLLVAGGGGGAGGYPSGGGAAGAGDGGSGTGIAAGGGGTGSAGGAGGPGSPSGTSGQKGIGGSGGLVDTAGSTDGGGGGGGGYYGGGGGSGTGGGAGSSYIAPSAVTPLAFDGPNSGAGALSVQEFRDPGLAELTTGPATTVGQTGVLEVSITNHGVEALTLDDSAISGANAGEFALTAALCATIDVDETCTRTLRFTPGAAGQRQATLTATYQTTEYGDFELSTLLKAEAVAVPTPTPTPTPTPPVATPTPVAPVATPVAPDAEPCTAAPVITGVERAGRTVRIRGYADPRLAGQPVSVVSDGTAVATAKVSRSGAFNARAKWTGARYRAVAGGRHSAAVQAGRRLVVSAASARAGRTVIAGKLSRTLAGRTLRVEYIPLRGCEKPVELTAAVKVARDGSFRLSVPTASLRPVVVRLTAEVRVGGKTVQTFSLPTRIS